MKFEFFFLGKTREKYLDAAIKDYADRLSRYVPVEIIVLKEKHSRRNPDEALKRNDAALLLEQVGSTSYCVVLDPGGQQPDSEQLAAVLGKWEDQGRQSICFLIGGHLGLHSSVLERADMTLSLSSLTFTHEMTRFILLEQLYRACSIKAGHNYHK